MSHTADRPRAVPRSGAHAVNALMGSVPRRRRPRVQYHLIYHPHHWRGWVDWGQGAIGDMGAHLIDHPFKALNLGLPTVIETLSTPFNGVCYPHATTTHYQFPARGDMPAVKLTWYDGGLTPPRPEELGDGEAERRGRHHLRGQQGQDDAADVRPRTAAAAASRCTIGSASRSPCSRASRTRRTSTR